MSQLFREKWGHIDEKPSRDNPFKISCLDRGHIEEEHVREWKHCSLFEGGS